MHGEAGELLEDLRRAALGARHGLVARADELLEMRLALHARVLVDRHEPSVLSNGVAEWTAPTLEGRIVRLEPLRTEHEEGLWFASRAPRIWRWLSVVQPQTREEWKRFVANSLDAAATGAEMPLVTISYEEVVGSTRFLALRPEHGSVEIGWTWLRPDVWSSGANVEAKYLQLRHAFETWGCRRVELKTDALNERSRGALEALGATFEGIHRKHMLVRGGENRDSAWYAVTDDDWPGVRAHLEARLAQR
ncbi:MAG: family N-acetyltransferase [Gaiellaceae bacterium]|nr:family N-acetyltransferase [Gaiellaceae bacterium]